jgi:hypothetical protein
MKDHVISSIPFIQPTIEQKKRWPIQKVRLAKIVSHRKCDNRFHTVNFDPLLENNRIQFKERDCFMRRTDWVYIKKWDVKVCFCVIDQESVQCEVIVDPNYDGAILIEKVILNLENEA